MRRQRCCLTLAAGVMVALAASSVRAQAPDPVAVRAKEPTPAAPRLVLALYYPWYGLQRLSGQDRHVGAIDAAHHRIANFAHYPLGGAYDSTDPVTLQRQMAELKSMGVDAIACSWWGEGDFTNAAIKKLLPVAGKAGLKVCLFLEQLPQVMRPGNIANGAAELAMVLAMLGSDPSYLKVGGRPVIFLHDTVRDQLGNAGWAQVLLDLETMMAPGALTIGDIEDGAQPSDAQVFDGLHYNDPAAAVTYVVVVRPRSLMRHEIRAAFHLALAQSAAAAARANHRLYVATVSPGIDELKEPVPPGHMMRSVRGNGEFYRDSWNAALATGADWVLIQSFNQWEDGTEIEPSVEFGNQYEQITQEFIAKFRAATPQSVPAAPSSPAAALPRRAQP